MRSPKIVTLVLLAGLVAMTSLVAAQDRKPTSKPAVLSEHPYPLAICPVSDQKLGGMGDPVIHQHEGREIRFCCKGCLPKFTKDPAKYLKKVDELIVKQQAKHYPTKKCVVSDELLIREGGKPVDLVYQNRLVRLCCKSCKKDFTKSPRKFLKKLDKAVIAHHKDHYPLKECVVSGQKLGSMGKPLDVVLANRLVRLCCGGCKKALLSEPAKYLAKLNHQHKEGHGDPKSEPNKKGHDHDKNDS